MRTRCPQCLTEFRITPEQLRVKAGKVRCGQCQTIFDAFDSLIEDGAIAPMERASAPAPSSSPASQAPVIADPLQDATLPPQDLLDLDDTLAAMAPALEDAKHAAEAPVELAQAVETLPDAPPPLIEAEPAPVPEASSEPAQQAAPEPPFPPETLEESARAAREAGLMAARDLSETTGYNRWSAGTLVLDAHGHIVDQGPAQRVLWPFVSVAVLLVLALIAQLAAHYRTDLVRMWPDLRALYTQLGSDVPLPRQPEWVSIETSDLQADAARGLLVLHATLKNRASFAQAWPALELTLTDAEDSVVTRRVLQATDYLPAKADAKVFAASSEIGLRLWIESKSPAAGYRLYVFYP